MPFSHFSPKSPNESPEGRGHPPKTPQILGKNREKWLDFLPKNAPKKPEKTDIFRHFWLHFSTPKPPFLTTGTAICATPLFDLFFVGGKKSKSVLFSPFPAIFPDGKPAFRRLPKSENWCFLPKLAEKTKF
jgi:hypothetical protein